MVELPVGSRIEVEVDEILNFTLFTLLVNDEAVLVLLERNPRISSMENPGILETSGCFDGHVINLMNKNLLNLFECDKNFKRLIQELILGTFKE